MEREENEKERKEKKGKENLLEREIASGELKIFNGVMPERKEKEQGKREKGKLRLVGGFLQYFFNTLVPHLYSSY